ncbi:MAG: toprim domain-containing protein [Acidithiobacillus sp.]|jgi:putative DNA primase/helicase
MSASSLDLIDQFLATLAAAGIELAPGQSITPDGTLHRVRLASDKPGQKTGWYRLHLDNPPAGVGGDWRTGVKVNWCAKRPERLSPAEREALRRRIKREQAEREAEERARHREAAQRGAWVWSHAEPASPSHEYLQRKHLAPGIARQRGASLVLPVVDFTGHLRGVQFIQRDGTKRFIGGMKKAGAWIPAGPRPDGTRPLWICEGWGTACALQAMRPEVCCIAGLDAGNLASVAIVARNLWPVLDIVICPDFDKVGRQKGQEAAKKARARILPPPAEIPEGATDWLDVLNAKRQGVAHA